MRWTRWLFLSLISAILFAVGATYINRKQGQAKNAQPTPPPLGAGLNAEAFKFEYKILNKENKLNVMIRATNMREVKDPPVVELEGVELELYHKDSSEFDLVKSAKVQFDKNNNTLYSEGDADIT